MLIDRLAALPARRVVRSLELAALVQPSSGGVDDVLDGALTTITRSLAERPEVRFVVQPPQSAERGDLTVQESAAAETAGHRRILLASTPRAGNTLVQRLVAESLGYKAVPAHSIDDVDLANAGDRALFQIHVERNDESIAFAARAGALVVTVARHPLDVLLSVLHFAQHEPQVVYWVDGLAFDQSGQLDGASPTSRAFLDWAAGPGAARLLAVTTSWWDDPTITRLRYEDVVAHPEQALTAVAAALDLNQHPATSAARQIQEQTLRGLANHHRWRGTPGGWRDLLPVDAAAAIHCAHQRVFNQLGYELDGPLADHPTAERNWLALRR